MRIKHKINVRIGDDANLTDILYGPNDASAEVVIDSMTNLNSGKMAIAAAATEDVPFGDVAAVKGCYLKVDGDAVIYLNGSTDAIQLARSSDATGVTAKFAIEADLTQVEVKAPVGSAIAVDFCVWGDVSS